LDIRCASLFAVSDVDGLEFDEFGQSEGTHFAADAACLVTAERSVEADRSGVDHEETGAGMAGDVEAALGVRGPHAAAEAVHGVVGDPDRVHFVVVGITTMADPKISSRAMRMNVSESAGSPTGSDSTRSFNVATTSS
jgi:hypothetical protein